MRTLTAVLLLWVSVLPLAAEPLADPVILTVSGATDRTRDGSVDLTRSEFEALGMTRVRTSTPWHTGVIDFDGVSGRDLIDYFGITGEILEAVALNDYKVLIPVADLRESGLIFATRAGGKPMSVRQKGPIFVIYPFDEHPELRNEKVLGRSIWQLRSIRVR